MLLLSRAAGLLTFFSVKLPGRNRWSVGNSTGGGAVALDEDQDANCVEIRLCQVRESTPLFEARLTAQRAHGPSPRRESTADIFASLVEVATAEGLDLRINSLEGAQHACMYLKAKICCW